MGNFSANRLILYCWVQPCRSENNTTIYSSRQRRLAAGCFDMIWIRRQEGEVYPANHLFISIWACSPAMYTIRIPTLTTSTQSCILLGSQLQLEVENHNRLLEGLKIRQVPSRQTIDSSLLRLFAYPVITSTRPSTAVIFSTHDRINKLKCFLCGVCWWVTRWAEIM